MALISDPIQTNVSNRMQSHGNESFPSYCIQFSQKKGAVFLAKFERLRCHFSNGKEKHKAALPDGNKSVAKLDQNLDLKGKRITRPSSMLNYRIVL